MSRRGSTAALATIIVAAAVTMTLALMLVKPADARAARASALPTSALSAKPIVASYSDPIYMNFQGILGESTAVGHPNWIDVSSWSWGSSQSGTQLPKFSSATVTVPMSRAVLPIQLQLAQRKSNPLVTIDFVKTSPINQFTYLRFLFGVVRVTSVSWSSGGEAPVESISFSFQTVKINYQYQPPTGNPLNYQLCWNLATQVAC
jgi:type VI secretion system secreted protein Hcp